MKDMTRHVHPNLVRTYGVFDIVPLMVIGVAMEVCTCSLADVRAFNGDAPAPMGTVVEFMRQILLGLAFLHANNIIHRWAAGKTPSFLDSQFVASIPTGT